MENVRMVLHNIDGLVQERRNSSALAIELRLSCTNLSTWYRDIPFNKTKTKNKFVETMN